MAAVTTWGEIKLATLQKMFSANGQTIKPDSSTTEYINGMPQVANEALELLSTSGKFLIGRYDYTNYPTEPIFGKMGATTIQNDNVVYKATGVKAYYFTAQGKASLTISVAGEELEPIEIDTDTFTVFKGLIENTDESEVVFTFEAPFRVTLRNIAFYDKNFESEEDIDQYEEYIHIRMKDVLDDFYQLAPNEIYYESESYDYIVANEYFQEAFDTLVIPRSKPGIYTIYYRRYPGKITFETPDDYELPIDPEVAALIPLYMASQLYKDDDNAISTVYRNEFEVARENLTQSADIQKREYFTSESGWV